jgi:protein-L-isoaspartate(D-aspartate) O-methyltransferase
VVEDAFARDRQRLVSLLRREGVSNDRVLQAIGTIPRERFVPPELIEEAYEDRALPIGAGQTISQPFIVARMTELLEPSPEDRVLEIGTGSAYQAAVLAMLAREVISIERHPELAERGRSVLHDLGIENVRVIVGDGTLGYSDAAPYEGALITAATPAVPQPIVDQCRIGARIVAPVGGRELQELTVFTKREDGMDRRVVEAVKFVPLIGRRGFPPQG